MMTEPFYAFANMVLDSSLPLPELQRRAGAPNCRIDLAPAPPTADDAWPCPSPREIRKNDGGHGYTIDFGGTARFEVSADGDHVCCRPAAGVSDAVLRHLLLDHVLPRVLCLRGLLVLHASTLRAPDGRAVAFLGASGAGKSTLAASLVAAGWRLLADDALVIEGSEGRPTAVPTYPGLRLWPDSAACLASGSEPADQNGNPGRVPKPSRDVARRAELAGSTRDPAAAKLRFDAASLGGGHVFSTTPASLARVYVVADEIMSGPPTVDRVAAGEALRRAFEEELRLADADRPSLQASLDRIATSGVLPLFRRLSYPRDFEVLPALHAAIERDLGT